MNTEDDILHAVTALLSSERRWEAYQCCLTGLGRFSQSAALLQVAADMALEFEQYDQALRCFSQLASLDSAQAAPLIQCALIHLKLGKAEDAKRDLNLALQRDPQAGVLLQNMIANGQRAAPSARPASPSQNSEEAATPPSSIPVIILHLGSRDYLQPVLKTATAHNPDVVLISNARDPQCDSRVRFADYRDFNHEGAHFTRIYQPLSSNVFSAELFCFTRWFILKDYMERHGIQLCFHIDSDVLLFANARNEFLANFNRGYEWTLVRETVGCTSFVTLEGLRRFCQFVRSVYENKSGPVFRHLVSIYERTVQAGARGGVSDMLLLELYCKECHASVGEMTDVLNGSTYDHNISVSDGYEMHGAYKKIYPRQGFPYCKRMSDGALIRFHSLHFQGNAKLIVNDVLQALERSR